MNIITKSDTKKFIALLKAGLKQGTSKELKTYSNASKLGGTDIAMNYYVNLEFSFHITADKINDIVSEDFLSNEIDDLLKIK